MKYYSSKNRSVSANFREALWKGLAPDGGLYCPEQIPLFGQARLHELLQGDRIELATEIIFPFVKGVVEKIDLQGILSEAIDFDIPLVKINDRVKILELFHGPTEAFKDVGARFMSRMMSHFIGEEPLTILVATSGDTGSAVADGFWNVEGIDVVVLFPKGGVSPYQESQMTTLGNNITAVEIEGTFDDCQDLVKQAFNDRRLRQEKTLSSANSINIGRLLPQMLYYFYAAQQLGADFQNGWSVCVPSGNFGNITSGLYARKMGLKFVQFIAATNANRTFPVYLESGEFVPVPSVPTLSNAMDVGKPSNFDRILDLFEGDRVLIKEVIKSVSISDKQTINTMRSVFEGFNYLLDPHAAVGWMAIEQLDPSAEYHHILLGTAHPRKFEKAVHRALPGYDLSFPENKRSSHKIKLQNNYQKFKELLTS